MRTAADALKRSYGWEPAAAQRTRLLEFGDGSTPPAKGPLRSAFSRAAHSAQNGRVQRIAADKAEIEVWIARSGRPTGAQNRV